MTPDLVTRVRREVDRSIRRTRNGVRYVRGSSRAKVGASPCEVVRRESGSDEVTLAGYCLGGVLASLFSARHRDAGVRNLVLMATPMDFDQMGAMVAALKEGRLNAEDLVDETGNVPADVLYSG